jgi:drug/metabolite transporter (DMT)-like permease
VLPSAHARAYAVLTLVAVLWGSYPAFSKLALAHISPFQLVAIRMVLASVFLVAYSVRRDRTALAAIDAAGLRQFALLGFMGFFVSMTGAYLGIDYTTASSASILQVFTPVMVAVGAHVILKERLESPQWAGVACSTVGVLLVVTRGGGSGLAGVSLMLGDFIILFSQLGWSGYTLYGKQVMQRYSPEKATTAAYLLGTCMLLPVAVATTPFYPAPNLAHWAPWFAIVLQGILGALAHVWWYEGVRLVGASRTAIFGNFQPVVGLALAYVMLGETIEPSEIAGALAVLVGVALTTRRPRAAGPS